MLIRVIKIWKRRKVCPYFLWSLRRLVRILIHGERQLLLFMSLEKNKYGYINFKACFSNEIELHKRYDMQQSEQNFPNDFFTKTIYVNLFRKFRRTRNTSFDILLPSRRTKFVLVHSILCRRATRCGLSAPCRVATDAGKTPLEIATHYMPVRFQSW